MKLTLHTDGRRVETRFTPRAEHVGFKHTIHGGIVSTLLDEVMAWACAVGGKRFSYCAELTVRFAHPMRPLETVVAVGEVIANRRGKVLETKAEARNEAGALLATATGKYIPVKANLAELATDLVGDSRWLLEWTTT